MYLFLLGGKDLEMVEIERLLIAHNQKYIDKKLAWGAKLSLYAEYFDKFREYEQVFGIELIEDIDKSEIPSNYKKIDHHNELSHLPSAIEQVAAVLGVELNRHQTLVAANDKGYIPAMQQLCATAEEIAEIRRLDRQAQGATDEDEQLAEKSIRENKTEKNGVTIIESLTEKFSCITDRLFPTEKLIVYTEKELNYYGTGKQKLVEAHKKEIENGKAYHGGGKNGFFGLTGAEITESIINEVIEIVK